nr:fibrous sheath CABYR-binding protein-like [Aegilops tauschii subsp. strangulata]
MQHAHLCERLFQLKLNDVGRVERTGKAEKTGKAAKAGKSLFGLPAGVVPLRNNSCQTAIIAMMSVFNAHGLDPTWAEPQAELVQAFFDNLSERYVHDEPQLIWDTTEEELAYITTRAEEAALAEEAGSLGTVKDEANMATEEREFAEWMGSAGEASGSGARVPLVEDMVEESAEEETEAYDSSVPGRKRVLRQTSSVSRDTETLTQRAAKRAKASTGAEPPASAPRTPVLVVISPDNSPRRSPRFSPQHPPPTDQEDIDTVIEEVTKDAEAEATKIAAGEAAKSAIEEAAKGPAGETSEAAVEEASQGPTGEPGKAAAEEAAKEPAEEKVANDQPSSPTAPAPGKYLRVGLFIRLPGTTSTRAPAKGEVFDDEALAIAGLQDVDEPSAGGGGSQEEQLLRVMSANFQKLQALHHARQDKVKSRMAAVDKAEADFEERVAQTQADIKKAQEAAKEQVAKDKAARQQQQALLDTQEEDLDEEIGKIVAQRTQELEQKHKDALDALALDQAGKVEKLELEREGLKKEISELTGERDTANRTLADLQVTISDKTKLLSEANGSIDDLKRKLDTLEGTLSEVMVREETLNKSLEDERRLRKDDAAAHNDFVGSVNLWISHLIDVAEKLTVQLAVMGMPDVTYS